MRHCCCHNCHILHHTLSSLYSHDRELDLSLAPTLNSLSVEYSALVVKNPAGRNFLYFASETVLKLVQHNFRSMDSLPLTLFDNCAFQTFRGCYRKLLKLLWQMPRLHLQFLEIRLTQLSIVLSPRSFIENCPSNLKLFLLLIRRKFNLEKGRLCL